MPTSVTFTGSPTWLRYAGYFALFVGALFGLMTFQVTRREHRAQHWPVAPGKVLAAEIRSRTDSARHGTSTVYWVKFTVLFEVPPEQCRPREPWIFQPSGMTKCWTTFTTLEGSRDTANEMTRRHPATSHAQFHYEPQGPGVRFAGDPAALIYPWSRIFATFGILGFGLGMVQFARRLETNAREYRPFESSDGPDPSVVNQVPAEESERTEFIDLKLR